MTLRRLLVVLPLAFWLLPVDAGAQPLGTFRWQLRPHCNVLTVAVTQVGGTYRLEGTDDQCGAASGPASVIGTAFLRADGAIGMGLNIVPAPGSMASPITTVVTLSSLSGTWRDQSGATGAFTFTPGAGNGGSPRPSPSATASIPAAFGLFPDGQFVARGTIGAGNIPALGNGVRMMWHPAKAAFRVGEASGAVAAVWNDNNIGINSMAFGYDTLGAGAYSTAFGSGTAAVGVISTAMGTNTQALGAYSTAMGGGTIASGNSSTAMGSGTRAQGPNTTATGNNTTASGINSFSSGEGTIASGPHAVATGYTTTAAGFGSLSMGSGTQALGAYSFAGGTSAIARATSSMAFGFGETLANAAGSFVWGDTSSGVRIQSDQPNQFIVRAAGGFRFASNSVQTTGVYLLPGANQFTQISDVNRKDHFTDLDGSDVLQRMAWLPIREWSYTAQGPSIRHIGPTAQDFHAAFGLGEDPLGIGTLDASGVALAGVKALEERTRDLAALGRMLADDNRALRRENEMLRERLERLEQRIGGK